MRANRACEDSTTPPIRASRNWRDGATLTVTLATLLVVVGREFFVATTFLGDDHLFLTFTRAVSNPLVPFVRDCHGGEYYRPIPMALWWLLARAGGGHEWPFALVALALHATSAALTAAIARALDLGRAAALTAAAIFFVAPAERDAALWFSASTDLLATCGVLASVLCLMRGRRAWSLLFAALAYFSKETALVLPALLLFCSPLPFGERPPRRRRAGEGRRPPDLPTENLSPPHPEGAEMAAMTAATKATKRTDGLSRPLRSILPHATLALLYLAARFAVLRGLGGTNDDHAPLATRALQIGNGLVHALVGDQLLPITVSLPLGLALLLWCVLPRDRTDRALLIFIALALAPLPLAGWVVGARYFYLPAVPLALLLGRRLAARGPALAVTTVALLLALGSAQAAQRRRQIDDYHARVGAAASAVLAGAAQGHRLFHVRSGIKDLDLVLKNQPAFRGRDDALVVLTDVPASFVLLPPDLGPRLDFLRASPPLPPAGAYHFGPHRIVGLARRDESPDLDDVVARLPELRFLALTQGSTGITWHDITERKRP